jgi:hypothetical protein
MENTRIVQLEGDSSSDVSVSFEDAFGEYSEARGRGRKRRDTRRRERQLGRIKRRADRKKSRRQMRTEAIEERLARREARKSSRTRRKGMGKSDEEVDEQESSTPSGDESSSEETPSGESSETPSDSSSQESPAPRTRGGDEGTQSSDDSGSEDEASNDEDSGYDEGDSQESESDESEFAGGSSYSFNGEIDNFDEYFTIEGDEFFNLDSVTYDDSIYDQAEFSNGAEDYFSSADGGTIQINPKLAKITERIEWNKELVARMRKKLSSGNISKLQAKKLGMMIKKREDTITQLSNLLDKYSNFASKKFGRKNANREIAKAKNRASMKRFRALGSKRLKMSPEEAMMRLKKRRRKRQGVTNVEFDLNPSISPNRIVVPAQETSSSFVGTGLNGLDDIADFDAPNTRTYDIEFSNANGNSGKKIIPIVVGIAVGIAVVYLIKKYKK